MSMHLHLPTQEEIREAYQEGEEAVLQLFGSLVTQVEELVSHIQELHEVIQQLQDQVKKNSRNSSQPPSSDGVKKPRTTSLRPSGNKPKGGQTGHQGHTLRQVAHPERREVHDVAECRHCHASLEHVEAKEQEKRQVFAIPAVHIEVTEHQVVVKECPRCGTLNKAAFPAEVTQPTQYGANVKSHAAYFTNDHHIPLERTADMFEKEKKMNTTHQYRPIMYFVLTFAITWINGFFLAVQSQGGEKSLINLLFAYMGPFIAALIMMYVFADNRFRADFRRRIYDLRLINTHYLPFVVLFLPLAMVLSILISLAFGQPVEQLRFAEEFKVFDGEVILSMIILVLVPVLEELGWRGYGVDSLVSKCNVFITSMIFAALWGIWHLPVFFIKGSYHISLWEQHPVFALNFFIGFFPLVIIMNYLFYKNQRSIFLLAFFHVLVNYSSELFEANQISKCIFTLVLTVVAAMIIIRNTSFFFRDTMNLDIIAPANKEN